MAPEMFGWAANGERGEGLGEWLVHPHTDTQTHRHTDTQTHRHTDTQTHRHTDRGRGRDRGRDSVEYHLFVALLL